MFIHFVCVRMSNIIQSNIKYFASIILHLAQVPLQRHRWSRQQHRAIACFLYWDSRYRDELQCSRILFIQRRFGSLREYRCFSVILKSNQCYIKCIPLFTVRWATQTHIHNHLRRHTNRCDNPDLYSYYICFSRNFIQRIMFFCCSFSIECMRLRLFLVFIGGASSIHGKAA